MRKKPDPAIVPVQSKMFAEGIPISEACEKAGVHPGTWSRWAAGGVPDLQKLRAIEAAVAEIVESEAPAAEPAPAS